MKCVCSVYILRYKYNLIMCKIKKCYKYNTFKAYLKNCRLNIFLAHIIYVVLFSLFMFRFTIYILTFSVIFP